MSTKTTFKRVALVAVAALGFGTLTLVPAANAASPISSISIGTIPAARVGAAVVVPITVNFSSVTSGETLTVAVKSTAAPVVNGIISEFTSSLDSQENDADSVLAFSTSAGAALGSAVYGAASQGNVTDDVAYVGAFCNGVTTAGDLAADTADCVAASAVQDSLGSATSYTYYVRVKPDLSGSYSFMVSASAGATTVGDNLSYVVGDTTAVFTVTTGATPATAVLTNIGGTTSASGTYGALLKVTLKDAAAAATALALDEAVNLTVSSGYIAKATVSSGNFTSVNPTTGALTTVALGAADFVNGMAFVNVKDTTAAGVTVVVSSAAGGSMTTAVTGSLSVTVAKTATVADAWVASVSNGGAQNTSSDYAGTYDSGTNTVDINSTATSVTLEMGYASAQTAAATLYSTITDIKGAITGAPGTSNSLIFDKSASVAATTSTESTMAITFLNAPGDTSASSWSFTHGSSEATTETVSFAASATTYGTMTVTPTPLRLATGSTYTFTGVYKDQYSNVKANVSVTVSFSGRNSAKASTTLITDATGSVSYTFTDTGSTGSSDTITFNAGGTATAAASVTYGTATAGSVLVTTPNTSSTTGVEEYPKDPEDISAGDGAQGTLQTVTALVKDADGNVMAGIPVTWTISGTGCAITSNTVTGYTAAAGTDSASVYAWLAGSCTITATAGGKSDDAPLHFAQETATDVRTIAAVVSGNSITVTAKDRFGNTIESVPLKATRTAGAGNFGGSSSATADTDAAGNATFIVSGGAATVKITFNSSVASTYGQSDALKGLTDGTTATSVFTATTVGTATTAEVGVGASYDAAGVNSLTVEVTTTDAAADAATAAADAAAEATDAANAATDAANAAAEAADAATAAAQDAADAVAALSTQVSEMIDALKKQITALTNLVIKIQKKVKA